MDRIAGAPSLVFDFPDGQGGRRRLGFVEPEGEVLALSFSEVRPALREVDGAARRGLYAAGYVAYEAAPAFDPALKVRDGSEIPLLWFGLYREPVDFTFREPSLGFSLSPWQPTTSREDYDRNIARIRQAIAEGITYQVNYTLRLEAEFEGDDWALYNRLKLAQGDGYCAYLDLGRFCILSASPELFFRREKDRIITRPMKGTVRRGRWNEEDQELSCWLAASEKNQAENVMIVDLLRNDLGRLAEIGSVRVPRLFEIERYRTVFQMTSTIDARIPPTTTLEDIMAALFPSGSVTGAPKVSTMDLIAQLEDRPRQVYCGSIGIVSPAGMAVFNVAIRTMLIDRDKGRAVYGVGGGIVWDSTAEDEYREALLKAAVLGDGWPRFDLLETLRWDGKSYFLLEAHLRRLARSAEYFDIPLSMEAIESALEKQAQSFPQQGRRVRLLVSPEGEVRVESDPLPAPSSVPLPVTLAPRPICRSNRFLYHKTTYRSFYDDLKRGRPEVFDVLLWNEEGELTEFTIGNLVLEMEGRFWTPPRESGLLPGVFRESLLRQGKIHERTLSMDDLGKSSSLWLINSLRGWVPVCLID